MNKPLISIIVPVFNRESLIGETLDSILKQTYLYWECLVIDDGSTDNTKSVVAEFVKEDHRFQYHLRPNNRPKGANACRNYGLKLSKGTYINWIDSDDLMHPDKLKLQVGELVKTGAYFCVCKSYLFNNVVGDCKALKSKRIISENPFEHFFKKQLLIPVQAPLFNKEFLLDHSYRFNETLQAGQEWELFARILAEFNTYAIVDKPLDYIREHPNRISGNITHLQEWNYYKARQIIYNKFNKKFSNDLNQYCQYFFLKSYKDFLRNGHYRHAFIVWRKGLINDGLTNFKKHIQLGLAFISFLIFKKGDIFLSKIST